MSASFGGATARPMEGRDPALALLADAVAAARSGRSTTLVVRGGPGSGRTAVLESVRARAAGFRVLCTSGVATETGLAGAGLHRLLLPVAGRVTQLAGALPRDQAAALGRLLGTGEGRPGAAAASATAGEPGEPADPLALGAAVLAVLSALSGEQPVLCLVDDAEQLDAATRDAVAFAARRAWDRPLVTVLAVDESAPCAKPGAGDLPGLPVLELLPLDRPAARRLVTARLADAARDDDPPDDVVTAIVELGHGNPLALVELVAGLTPGQAQGLEPLPDGLGAGSALRRRYARRLRALSPPARRLVIAVAATPELDVDTALRIGADPSVGMPALDEVEASGLVEVDPRRVRVPDPLARACLYAGARLGERLAAHRLLAAVLDHERYAVERTWHRAAAVTGPDDAIADELRDAATAAERAGDHAMASQALQRSAALTATPGAAGERLVEAARAAWVTGDGPRARALLRQARPLASTGPLRALVDLLQGEIEVRSGTAENAYDALARVADGFAGPGRPQAVSALIREIELSELAGDHPWFLAMANRIGALRGTDENPVAQLLFDHFAGLSAAYRSDHARAARPLRRVVELAPATHDTATLVLAVNAALFIGELSTARKLAEQAVAEARAKDPTSLPYALAWLAFTEARTDRYPAASAHAQEGVRLSRHSGQGNSAASNLAILALLAGVHGDGDEVVRRARTAARDAEARGLARPMAISTWGAVRLALAEDRPDDAGPTVRALVAGGRRGMHLSIQVVATPDLVEAAVHHGQRAWAAEALAVYETWAEGIDSAEGKALCARGHALLAADDDEAGEWYREAVALHAGSENTYERARTLLLQGRGVRRRRRPGAAREPLHEALEAFERLGATPWADRARSELRAAGGAVPAAAQPSAGSAGSAIANLTPQQAQIARLVSGGATNREIAAQLFLSPRTVDHHLRNIFARLGVRSRVELARRLT
jgi:DNA-binding CsgD family transcriptional regulator/tetratricopeptide (TPR) repeat protein